MKKTIAKATCLVAMVVISFTAHAQINLDKLELDKLDLSKIRIEDLLSKAMRVDKGFSPKFYINDIRIPKVEDVAKILGMKQSEDINKLFRTFRTGRTIFQVTTYAGSAIAVYGVIRKIDAAASKQDYQTAFATAVGAVGTGVLVKLLTKGASYKAVDLFNQVAIRTIKDIFKLGVSSDGTGVSLYVCL